MARLKLATYNINGIRARLPALMEWLECEQPDIACLQELKAPDEAFPEADLERLGYGAIWHGQKSWNGVAILARGTRPEERRRGLPGGSGDTHSRYLEASVHGLVVGALYLPNGNPWPGPKFEYKLAWFERLIRHARTLLDSGEAAVLAGDFNVVPTDELDIYDPKSWRKDALLQPESRAAWFRLLDQGWTDSLRTVVGDAKVFTFWDYFRRHWERDAGLRIDHLLLSPPLARALSDAGVDRWVRGRPGASDHAPTWVVLDAGGASRTRKTRGARTTSAGQASAGARTARGRNSRTGAEPRARAAGRGAVPGVATRPRVAPAGSGDAAKASSGAVKKAARKVASPGSTPEAGKATSTSARKPATKKSRAPAQAATKRAARGVPKAATRKAKRATPNAPSGKLPPESTRVVVEKTTAPPRKTAKPR